MARPLKIEYDGAPYHVTACGNERKRIFGNDTDRKLFLFVLAQVIRDLTGSATDYLMISRLIKNTAQRAKIKTRPFCLTVGRVTTKPPTVSRNRKKQLEQSINRRRGKNLLDACTS